MYNASWCHEWLWIKSIPKGHLQKSPNLSDIVSVTHHNHLLICPYLVISEKQYFNSGSCRLKLNQVWSQFTFVANIICSRFNTVLSIRRKNRLKFWKQLNASQIRFSEGFAFRWLAYQNITPFISYSKAGTGTQREPLIRTMTNNLVSTV